MSEVTEETKKEVFGVGFYFGHSFCSVGFFNKEENEVEIIKNEFGNEITPGYISFVDDEIFIGEEAYKRARKDPKNTLFALKSLIGRKSIKEVEELVKLLPFTVIEESGKLFIEVFYQNEQKKYTPEKLLGMIVEKMTRIAEEQTGGEVRKCVFAVPANFNDRQRQAMKDIGQMCGLKVLRIVNEPTASAIGCDSDQRDNDEKQVLVYRMGKFSSDVTLLLIEEGIFEIWNQPETIFFGGDKFTEVLISHCCEVFHRRNQKDPKNDSVALEKLYPACEKAIIELSEKTRTTICIDSLFDGIDFNLQISRSKFDEMITPLLRNSVMPPVRKALDSRDTGKVDIRELIIIGGTANSILRIQSILKAYLKGVPIVSSKYDPLTLITRGVSIQCSILCSSRRNTQLLGLLDFPRVNSSYGIEGVEGVFRIIVPHRTNTPCRKSIRVTNQKDDQDSIQIRIFEGFGLFVKDNNFMGEIEISNLPRVERRKLDIEVTIQMSLDRDWNIRMTLSAKLNNYNTNNSIEEKTIQLEYPERSGDARELEKLYRIEMNSENEEEKKYHDLIQSRYQLFDLLFETNQTLQNETIRKKLEIMEAENDNAKDFEILLTEIQKWMDENESRCEKQEEFEEKIEIFHGVLFPILRKIKNELKVDGDDEDDIWVGKNFKTWMREKEYEEMMERMKSERIQREKEDGISKPTFDDLDVD